jgi:hypothetical protein
MAPGAVAPCSSLPPAELRARASCALHGPPFALSSIVSSSFLWSAAGGTDARLVANGHLLAILNALFAAAAAAAARCETAWGFGAGALLVASKTDLQFFFALLVAGASHLR